MGLGSVTVVVEGETDRPVANRLLELVGLEPHTSYIMRGKDALDRRLPGYNNAARFGRWLVLRDLDHDDECGPNLACRLLPRRSRGMELRIAVRSIEAWLLADAAAISDFLRVGRSRVPRNTEVLDDPKAALVNLARRSPDRGLRTDMVPAGGTSARVGPGYAARIIEFAGSNWRPQTAARRNPSLAKCIAALRRWSEG